MLNLANRFDPMDPSVQVDTFVELTDGTVISNQYEFVIIAKAVGGPTFTKEVNLDIIICGNEQVSYNASLTRSWTLDILPDAVRTLYNFTDLFSTTDPYCPPINFDIVTNNVFDTEPTEIEEPNFYLL